MKQVQHEQCECKCRLNKSICISKQNWNHNVGMCVKNQIIEVFVKMIICGILARMIGNVIRHVKIDEYLDIKNC